MMCVMNEVYIYEIIDEIPLIVDYLWTGVFARYPCYDNFVLDVVINKTGAGKFSIYLAEIVVNSNW